jgi:hypothetical protein
MPHTDDLAGYVDQIESGATEALRAITSAKADTQVYIYGELLKLLWSARAYRSKLWLWRESENSIWRL